MSAGKRIVIIGAGPCGLAAGWALNERGHENYTIIERSGYAGGLSASFVDQAGFTWDVGGHVLFSHYREFDEILGTVMKGDMVKHLRKSFVRSLGKWVPYPFQNNLSFLPPEAQLECLLGLKRAGEAGVVTPAHFGEWIEAVFGAGIAKHFMRPYNWKVWGVPPELMSAKWIGERVSVVDFDAVLKNVIMGSEDSGWGPNAEFQFPSVGGTGEIFSRMAKPLKDKIRYNTTVSSVVPDEKAVLLSTGERVEYDYLINTTPIDKFLGAADGAPEGIVTRAGELVHNGVIVVGLGFETPLVDKERCWMYFPEDNAPFYRVTNFAKYSKNNVPSGNTKKYSSYLCETSYSSFKSVDREKIIDETRDGLLKAGVIDEKTHSKEVTRFMIDADYGYPVPTIERDEILREAQNYLMDRSIYSRGRFGAWRYESGNMDHSVKMGLEVVAHLLEGESEKVWRL